MQGTNLIPNIYAVHHDDKIWEKPEVFDPFRHLDGDNKFVKSENVIAFGLGKFRRKY